MERKSDMKDKKDLNSTKIDQREKTPERQKKIPPGAWMFVLCLLYKDGNMERKVT
jgi:hypothetical protein